MTQYEKLGAFYLGREHDLANRKTTDDLLLYDAKDLTTHAICVGMTGSGKTGLCVSLLEEAALDGIPAIAIDPKGDLGNLLLTFPQLRGQDFRPWINEDDARRKSLSPDQFAEQQAELWRNGLASWQQSGERIARLREAADFAIYTPGSEAGIPISVLSSFAAPPEEVRSDGELLRERVTSTATSLLGLMGIEADPVKSREHILLSTLFDHAWRQGQDVELAGLIQMIQSPPIQRFGVLELDSFYPPKDRFELAMQLNNLLASPSFRHWMEGQPLDIQSLLYTPAGKPRVAILHIAHLSDAERMFFVSLVLHQMLGWMRTRPGTSSLRALLYMDEIFGFIPPTAEPSSKRPFLTLLKQARAYGLGVVLATQNPVDLDYKGLSNTGTWFLGRLQTERDKMRVLEGLEGAAAGGRFDKAAMEQTLAGLGKRVFLMHNVHENEPVVFHTRWAMSYLCGPLAREQIKKLTPERAAAPAAAAAASEPAAEAARAATAPPAAQPRGATRARPVLAPGIRQVFLSATSDEGDLSYHPGIVGLGKVRYVDSKTKKVKHSEEVALLLPLRKDSHDISWDDAAAEDLCVEDLESDPEVDADFGALPANAEKARSYTSWRKQFSDRLYRESNLTLLKSETLGLIAEPGESEGDFRVRLADLAREKRDRLADKLKKKYARRVDRLEDRIRRAAQVIEKEQEQASGQKMQTAISMGATVLSALFGRKRLAGTLGRATTTIRGVGRSRKETLDIQRAEQNLAALEEQLAELNAELEAELDEIEDRMDAQTETLEEIALRPRRADVTVRLVSLAWMPYRHESTGEMRPIWK